MPTETSEYKRSELKKKTFYSIFWTAVRNGSGAVLTLLVFCLLARLLTPAEFGAFALASAFVEFTKIISGAGFGDALTQVKQLDEELAASAFWANLALGLTVGAITWAVAPVYARIIGQPEVGPILEWLSVLVPISALGGMHLSRKLREFGHKSVAARTVAANLLGGGGAVLAAAHGFGVWSFVIQAAVSDVVGVAFAWWAFPWVPPLRFSWRRLKTITSFSAHMTLAQILWLMLTRARDVIIGSFLTAASVGTFRIASRLFEAVSQLVLLPIMTVSLVTLSRLQDDPVAFANAYGRMLGIASLLAIPAMFGLGFLADDLVIVLFGPQWAASAIIIKILAFTAAPYTLSFLVSPPLSALGRSNATLKVAIAMIASTVVLTISTAPFGLTAAAMGSFVAAYAIVPYNIFMLRHEAGIPIAVIVRNLLTPMWASLFMGVGLLGLEQLMQHTGSPLLRVACGSAAGVLAYVAGLFLFGRGFLASQCRAVRTLLTPSEGGGGTGAVVEATRS